MQSCLPGIQVLNELVEVGRGQPFEGMADEDELEGVLQPAEVGLASQLR